MILCNGKLLFDLQCHLMLSPHRLYCGTKLWKEEKTIMPVWVWITTVLAAIGVIVTGVKNIKELLGWMSKPYKKIHSQAESIERKLAELTANVNKNDMITRRLELMLLMEMEPDNEAGICKAHDEYKSLGGNTYIDEQFAVYIQKRKVQALVARSGGNTK